MAIQYLTSAIGNSVGPSQGPTKFHLEIQLGYDNANADGYEIYARRLVHVTANPTGINFTSNLICSWTTTKYTLGKIGTYADSGWKSLGTKAYGTKVSVSDNCYYTGGSGSTYKSSATASYTIPTPTYIVGYDANGGVDAPSEQTKTHGVDLVLSADAPTKVGYTFLGWDTSDEALAVVYAQGDTYTANANATLYAVWEANQYELTIRANGGAFADGTSVKYTILEYESTLGNDIGAMLPIRNGHELLGFHTADGTRIYDSMGACVPCEYWKDSTFKYLGDLEVFAKWRAVEDQDIYIYPDGRIYAREFIVEEGLTDIVMDFHGDIYASAFVQADAFDVRRGILYAKEFIEGKPS